MPDHYIRDIWALMASIAGAITALSSRPFKKMNRIEVIVSIMAGTSFAFFVGPWVAKWVFGDGPVDIRVMGGLFYLLASGSNVLIPLAIQKLTSLAGLKEEEGRA